MATLKYSRGTKLIFLKMPKLTLCFQVLVDIKDIYSITRVVDGFITIETDYGEEYIDFVELIEVSGIYNSKDIKKMTKQINQITLDNLKLEVL